MARVTSLLNPLYDSSDDLPENVTASVDYGNGNAKPDIAVVKDEVYNGNIHIDATAAGDDVEKAIEPLQGVLERAISELIEEAAKASQDKIPYSSWLTRSQVSDDALVSEKPMTDVSSSLDGVSPLVKSNTAYLNERRVSTASDAYPTLPKPIANSRARNVITEVNNFAQKHHMQYPIYAILPGSSGLFGGTMTMGERSYYTSDRFVSVVEAKTDFAKQAYKSCIGSDFIDQGSQPGKVGGNMLDVSRMNGPDQLLSVFPNSARGTTHANERVATAPSQHGSLSFEMKLSSLLNTHALCRDLRYVIQPHMYRPGFNGEPRVGGQSFKIYYLASTTAMARELVAGRGYRFFMKALAPTRMQPVAGFQQIKDRAKMLSPAQRSASVTGGVSINIQGYDKNGRTVTKVINDQVVGTLSQTLQSCYRQNPERYERLGFAPWRGSMFACLLHWPAGTEVFGSMTEGYPDAKLARMAAAAEALKWIDEKQSIKRQ